MLAHSPARDLGRRHVGGQVGGGRAGEVERLGRTAHVSSGRGGRRRWLGKQALLHPLRLKKRHI
jgi:hypothetical protein